MSGDRPREHERAQEHENDTLLDALPQGAIQEELLKRPDSWSKGIPARGPRRRGRSSDRGREDDIAASRGTANLTWSGGTFWVPRNALLAAKVDGRAQPLARGAALTLVRVPTAADGAPARSR